MNSVVLTMSMIQFQVLQHRFIVMCLVLFFSLKTGICVMELVLVPKNFLFSHNFNQIIRLSSIFFALENLFFRCMRFMRFNSCRPNDCSSVNLFQMLKEMNDVNRLACKDKRFNEHQTLRCLSEW